MKTIKCIHVCGMVMCLFLSACKSAKSEGRNLIITKIILQQCKNILEKIESDRFNIDIAKDGNEYNVRSVIPEEMFEGDFNDGWGNPIHCMAHGDVIYVWSNGPNLINDHRRGDDVVLEFKFKSAY
jgi:hypothetical protein